MVEASAQVIVKSETYAWVEAERRTSCHGCTLSQGCGTGSIAKYLMIKPIMVKASNPVGAEAGDRVIVGLPEKAFLQGSFLLYMVPLLAMLLGAGLGGTLAPHFGGNEGLEVLLGLGGLAGGLLGVRYMRMGPDLEPKILRTVGRQR
ncbi:positive regulator of sigma(E), RseC/MucC [Nitrosococcus oceani ATCC 19707]|uniref:Positive regulator of sigma(E), RseC/MucC n=2 Tax=Nitrosococcus oceani TaxID=1229 RepID=Q3J8D0_NITOC|nr:SoxR reducing system RseC family protein [Nitrosococcus oceani]ABA58916.1 positive regulator of sigma(E), RseC/MucC [Nitrosococcus oceani ATCC 19707]EDZ68076.1 Positive regulator of sigma(E), RseC/MucC superfamily [Nitrosococcus oceani AFC27]KFI18716.1 positive regulator of sigma(E) RseC/MucC [Nitrosococcus oceani C-27]GEM18988.1 positive regulator of sigma(E), RseC/MucC superfamily [Nitrosococcus oceani]